MQLQTSAGAGAVAVAVRHNAEKSCARVEKMSEARFL